MKKPRTKIPQKTGSAGIRNGRWIFFLSMQRERVYHVKAEETEDEEGVFPFCAIYIKYRFVRVYKSRWVTTNSYYSLASFFFDLSRFLPFRLLRACWSAANERDTKRNRYFHGSHRFRGLMHPSNHQPSPSYSLFSIFRLYFSLTQFNALRSKFTASSS